MYETCKRGPGFLHFIGSVKIAPSCWRCSVVEPSQASSAEGKNWVDVEAELNVRVVADPSGMVGRKEAPREVGK